ncbi:MAG: alanine--tRNA ligase [Parachlamydiales bacterium]
MLSHQIRKKFLDYFVGRGHTRVPSAPVVPHDDPTLLFVNAGMVQFKDLFLGKRAADYKRAASSQKCVRVGGKHNDLENVGHTTRHLTLFEMLGNFSFGDYFKAEAIEMAWELATGGFSLDGGRIWASVFREDDEAYELWRQYLPAERIVRLDERDNFWAMGDTGPCGPCSELLYDRGGDFGKAKSPYEDTEGERFFEFWNLVFMQYERDGTGQMRPLPKPCVDTGAGLERLALLKQGKHSVFETDVLQAIIGRVEELSGQKYGEERAPFHVVADHLRMLAFAIADGAIPSNVDRGYVLRKVLRRAVRYGRQLGFTKPFMGRLLPTLIGAMGADFPELERAAQKIEEVLTTEEEAFFRTLLRGGNLLNQIVEGAGKRGTISGDDAFKLKDTYGLPLEEIVLLARDASLTVDLDRYQALEEEARERSKRVHKKSEQRVDQGIYADLVKRSGESQFLGYGQLEAKGKVMALYRDSLPVAVLEAGEEGLVVLDQTPFYAEKGGQVGDTGYLHAKEARFSVEDTTSPYTGVIAHHGQVVYGSLKLGDEVKGEVDQERRDQIAANHTATHLLHWALQQMLGEQVGQAGSVVAPERLRFDFNHHKALSKEEIRQLEDLVNSRIREDCPVETYELTYAEAQKREDIKQFFGDKYGARVRVIDMGFSKELCGGTHTTRSGRIGTFLITEEGSIAAGVRRIVALTGQAAIDHIRAHEEQLEEIASLLKTKRSHLLERASQLMEENTHYAAEIKMAKKRELKAKALALAENATAIGPLPCVVEQVEEEDLKALADEIAAYLKQGVIVLGSGAADKAQLVARMAGDVPHDAKALISEISPLIKGGGGGKRGFAQAGGRDPSGLRPALERARAWIASHPS